MNMYGIRLQRGSLYSAPCTNFMFNLTNNFEPIVTETVWHYYSCIPGFAKDEFEPRRAMNMCVS